MKSEIDSPENSVVTPFKAHLVHFEILNMMIKPEMDSKPQMKKLLFISEHGLFITRLLIKGSQNWESLKESVFRKESSEYIFFRLDFDCILELSFGNFEKFSRKQKFPIKIRMLNGKRFFIELVRSGYLKLRNILGRSLLSTRDKSQIYNLDFANNWGYRILQVDSSELLKEFYESLVIKFRLLNEEQFQRIAFNKKFVGLNIKDEKEDTVKDIEALKHEMTQRRRKNKFRVEYLIPDLWEDPEQFVICKKEKSDLLHSVVVPYLDKVPIHKILKDSSLFPF